MWGRGSISCQARACCPTRWTKWAWPPEEITHLVITHAHPDHIWGLLDDFDEPFLPNAQIIMGRAEWDYWMDPNTIDTIGAERQSFAVGAARRLEVIADQVMLIEDGAEVVPGVLAVASPGHTPGHMSYQVQLGGQGVLVTGDAIGNGHVAFERPEFESAADQDSADGGRQPCSAFGPHYRR